MKKVLISDLSFVLIPLAPMNETEEQELYKVDGQNKATVVEVFLSEVKPVFELETEETRQITRNTLEYVLSTTRNTPPEQRLEGTEYWNFFTYIYDRLRPAMEQTYDPRLSFVWLWEALFGNEDYYVPDLSEYVVVEDE